MNEAFSQLTEGELMERTLAGDRDAFDELAKRFRGALHRGAVSRLRRADWAEDVVQETFLNAWRWRSSYDSQYSVRSWLWTILLNNCRRLISRVSRKPAVASWTDQSAVDAEPPSPASADAAPEDAAVMRERSQQLEQLLATLPEPEADALRMRFFGGLKYQEIADAMQSSLSGAKKRVRNGLARMTEQMTSSDSFLADSSS